MHQGEFPHAIEARLAAFGIDARDWRQLKLAALLHAALADGRLSPEESEALRAHTGTSQKLYRQLRQQAARETALTLLDDVVGCLPRTQAEGFVADLETDFRDLRKVWNRETPLGTLRQHLSDFLERPQPRADVIELAMDQLLGRLAARAGGEAAGAARGSGEVRPLARAARHGSAASLSLESTATRGPEWGRQVSRLLTDAASLLEDERGAPGFSLAAVRTFADLERAPFNATVADSGVVFVPAAVSRACEVYFVGDIHGDRDTLRRVIEVTGAEQREDVMLLFLGDYIDRGPESLETLLAVLELKCAAPERVILLRGNHDGLVPAGSSGEGPGSASAQNRLHGWEQPTTHNDLVAALAAHRAALRSTEDNDWPVHRAIARVFDAMPAFAILEPGVAACHAGPIPRFPDEAALKGTVDPEFRRSIAVEMLADLRRPEVQNLSRWIRCDFKPETCFVWNGSAPPSAFDYGDVESFLKVIGASVLLRGHDHVEEGYLHAAECPGLVTLCTSHSMDDALWRCTPAIARCDAGTGWAPVRIGLDPVPGGGASGLGADGAVENPGDR